MDYDFLKQVITRYKTDRIKMLNIPGSCSPKHIPESFSSLIVDVIKTIDICYQQLSKNKRYIAIVGLQPMSITIKSLAPIKLNRVANKENKNSHFCCSLSYLLLDEEGFERVVKDRDWSGAENIVIDFTRGLVMNKERYFHELFNESSVGKIYGKLNFHKLNEAWVNAGWAY